MWKLIDLCVYTATLNSEIEEWKEEEKVYICVYVYACEGII